VSLPPFHVIHLLCVTIGNSYTQTIPSRFKKDVLKAATVSNSNTQIGVEGLNRVICNIELQNRVTSDDVEVLFAELGDGGSGMIPVDRMMAVL